VQDLAPPPRWRKFAICAFAYQYKLLLLQSKARFAKPRQRGEYQNIDDETLKRMKNIEKLTPEDKSHVYSMLDAFFAKSKLQSLLL